MEKTITKAEYRNICKEVAADIAVRLSRDDKSEYKSELGVLATIVMAKYTAEIIAELFKETEEIIIVEKE